LFHLKLLHIGSEKENTLVYYIFYPIWRNSRFKETIFCPLNFVKPVFDFDFLVLMIQLP